MTTSDICPVGHDMDVLLDDMPTIVAIGTVIGRNELVIHAKVFFP